MSIEQDLQDIKDNQLRIMKLFKLFFPEKFEELCKCEEYTEDWKVIPLDDCREYYWNLVQWEDGSGHVNFQEDKPEDPTVEWMYQNDIYTQRFLTKWVYRTEELTLICVDTHCDGNKFLSVFDNSKEITL